MLYVEIAILVYLLGTSLFFLSIFCTQKKHRLLLFLISFLFTTILTPSLLTLNCMNRNVARQVREKEVLELLIIRERNSEDIDFRRKLTAFVDALNPSYERDSLFVP